MSDNEPTTFTLGPNDGALIIRGDGKIESALPTIDDDTSVSSDSPTFAIGMFMILLTPEGAKIYEGLCDWFISLAREEDDADDEAG
jgi:hypothetical protein